MKSSLKNSLAILISILFALLLKVFLIQIYTIPSSSMEPSLLPGDVILVSKRSYGARILKISSLINKKEIEYFRTKGWASIQKNDLFVFNKPIYGRSINSYVNIFGGSMVKRCYSLPGDSVLIKKQGINDFKSEYSLFPQDSSINWHLDSYGPLYVPAKGDTIILTKRNLIWYKDVFILENNEDYITDSIWVKNGVRITKYIFKKNYYFVLGDNFFNSADSRYWGFVPEDNIIGKVTFVLFSIDKGESGFKKIRWDRFLKKVQKL